MKVVYFIRFVALSVWMRSFCLTALLMSCCLVPLQAQYMQLQLIVQNEVAVGSPRNFSIGMIPPAYGWVQINAEDMLAGRFEISAQENIWVQVSLFPPDQLQRDRQNTLPLRLEASWNNSPEQSPGKSFPFENQQAYFPIHNGGLLREKLPGFISRLRATVLVHGAAYVGNVEPGVYYGEIGVRVEYE
jgi:hypothetical protein